ncbi:MAG: hypothetical protein EU532_07910 [Promethearchaeota archaeon]|nr:MAG: hypothetical protein EU532_07910 [Candidatus Lokiarchaeota archaeon]
MKRIRFIEYQIVIGDSPPGIITNHLRNFTHIEHNLTDEILTAEDQRKDKDSLFPEGVIHHLSKERYIWNFSLIYREKSFDIIKWRTSFTWKEKEKFDKNQEVSMEKGLFIGVNAGIFFILIDEDIFENFNKLADMMDIFLEKTGNGGAPFLVYGLIENKQKIIELKTNKELLKNLADVKKWVSQHGGEFRLENLKEIRLNLSYLITEYSHFILSKLKTKTNYPHLQVGELHYLDYEDLSKLKEIEHSLSEQLKTGETIDKVLSELFFEYLKMPEFQEEAFEPLTEPNGIDDFLKEPFKPKASKIKIILEEIRKGIRRQCPNCFNKDRNKIREIIDRENIIMKNPNIYGWKYACGICGHIWRIERDSIEYEIERNKDSKNF